MAPVPAVQLNVTALPARVEPGVGTVSAASTETAAVVVPPPVVDETVPAAAAPPARAEWARSIARATRRSAETSRSSCCPVSYRVTQSGSGASNVKPAVTSGPAALAVHIALMPCDFEFAITTPLKSPGVGT